MSMLPIRIPTLVGGVSRAAQSQRPPHVVEVADNVTLSLSRGAEKRAGTEFILAAGGTGGSLNVTDPTNTKHVAWIDRDSSERFLVLIDPAQGSTDAEVVEIFDLAGAKKTVNYNATNPRPYIIAGAGDARRRLRMITIADASFIMNRTVVTALSGAAIDYKNEANSVFWRQRSSANNYPSWSDFPHPPSAVVTPVGDTTDDAIYYAREDDLGWPQGFYAAISTTQPPWYQRIRTEGANSLIDASTMPVQITFNGTDFAVARVTWTDRLSGDSAINPGPTFIGGSLTDFAFHQGRMFFAGGERLVSSIAGDLFNLWIDNSVLQVDSDPVEARIGNNRVSNITHLTTFRDSLVMHTTGGRQFELRSDGPLAPGTARMEPTTALLNVDYVQPTTMGDQLYFAGERNFANTLYEYYVSPTSLTNVALDITQTVEGYIPAEVSLLEASEAHDMLFVLTDAEPNNIYVYKTSWNGDQKILSAWYRWTTDEDNAILSCHVFDDDLYLLVKRDSLLWLEKVSIEQPEEDTEGNLTMGYQVRVDRKQRLLGAYDPITNTTVWTLADLEDDTITEIVLAEEWDNDSMAGEERLKGVRLQPTVLVSGGDTVLTVEGQYETTLDGNDGYAYIGRPYTMQIRLSEQFPRDQQGQALNGNVQLLTGTIRHKDTGYYKVEVTPTGRETFTHEFVFPRVGSTPLDSDILDAAGEFRFRILAAAYAVTIDIKNDSPMPCNIVDMEIITRFVPQRGNPNK